jgi:DNA invertase Pin-like site-specific DNA recombinase
MRCSWLGSGVTTSKHGRGSGSIPPAHWPAVLRRVAQGESLRQIARSYNTSHEAVRRVLNAARMERLSGEDAATALHPADEKQ